MSGSGGRHGINVMADVKVDFIALYNYIGFIDKNFPVCFKFL
jgi:hypothetical protein